MYFVLPDSLDLGSTGQRFRNVMEVLRVLAACREGTRQATANERAILCRWPGLGDTELRKRVLTEDGRPTEACQGLIADGDLAGLARSTLNAHYTDLDVCRAMWGALERLGLNRIRHPRILEPACGVGHFIGTAPAWVREAGRFAGVELEGLTAEIARLLYPEASIQTCGLEEACLPEGRFDIVVGNWPFGDYGVADARIKKKALKGSIHNYFWVRALQLVRPGGIVLGLTSRYTMDGTDGAQAVRHHLFEQAELVGACRLPDSAFRDCARKAVVTDLLAFRRRPEPIRLADVKATIRASSHWSEYGPSIRYEWEIAPRDTLRYQKRYTEAERARYYWNNQDTYETSVSYNWSRYYKVHPDAVLGEVGPGKMQHDSITVRLADPDTLQDRLQAVIGTWPEGILEDGPSGTVQEGYGADQDQPVPVKATEPTTTLQAACLAIYRAAKDVLAGEASGDEDVEERRGQLVQTYQAFRTQHGALTVGGKRAPLVCLAGRPEQAFLAALERSDGTPEVIFEGPVTQARQELTASLLPEDALLACLDRLGRVDLDWIADAAGLDAGSCQVALAGRIFRDPETAGAWTYAPAYLSGDIRARMRVAREEAILDPAYLVNVQALEAALPAPKPAHRIGCPMGAPWVPADVVTAFLHYLMPATDPQENWGRETVANYVDLAGTWILSGDWGGSSIEARQTYGTARRGGLEIFTDALNNRIPIIYDEVRDGDSKKQVRNEAETMTAQAKYSEIRRAWQAWIWSDVDQTDRLASAYNERFNGHVVRQHDGAHLTFPEMSRSWSMRPHQRAGIDRIITSSCDQPCLIHDLGVGKTSTSVGAAVKGVQIGACDQAWFAVPKSAPGTGQWFTEFLKVYPGKADECLVAEDDDLGKAKRGTFLSRMATGGYRYVFMTHEQFQSIPLDWATVKAYVEAEVEAARDYINGLEGDDPGKRVAERTFKRREAMIERLRIKYKDRTQAVDRDDPATVTLEEIVRGRRIWLFADECFPYHTKIFTNIGYLDIGLIVEKRLNVLVMSHKDGIFEWNQVTHWWKKPSVKTMVRVTHENGSFVCTEDHKIWTSEGYVKACKLTTQSVLIWREDGQHQDTGTCHETMRGMRTELQSQGDGGEIQRETSVLRNILCCEVENEAAGEIRKSDADYVGSSEGNVDRSPSTSIGTHDQQPDHGQSSLQSQDDRKTQGSTFSCASWRQRSDIDTSEDACRCTWMEDGIGCTDEAVTRDHEGFADILQGGHCQSGSQDRHRSRWSVAQDGCNTREGHQENECFTGSRVVGIQVLERGDPDLTRLCGGEGEWVYDLEVENNHNYFAEGILVSNCQVWKNDMVLTNMVNIAGLPRSESQRAFDARLKYHYLHGLNGKTVELTATPVTNTLGEAYVVMRRQQAGTLKRLGLEHFDAWAGTFAEAYPSVEQDAAGRYRFVTRLRWQNVPELFAILGLSWDRARAVVERPSRTGGRMRASEVPGTDSLRAATLVLAERLEAIGGKDGRKRPPPEVDNALLVTHHGRLQSMFNGPWQDGFVPGVRTKVDELVDNAMPLYHETMDLRGTQLIFCDLFTPRAAAETGDGMDLTPEEAFLANGVYGMIRNRLLAAGVPAGEIAFIHDADTVTKRKRLFADVNTGRVRFLLGSTQKMGTGVNVQERCRAGHLLTIPWRADQLLQAEGRYVRPGNLFKVVDSFVYVTGGSFDPVILNLVEKKAEFMVQILTGEISVEEMDDLGEVILDARLAKAVATGDRRHLDKIQLELDLMVALREYQEWRRVRLQNLRDLADLPGLASRERQEATRHRANAVLMKDQDRSAYQLVRGMGMTDLVTFDKRNKASEHLYTLAQIARKRYVGQLRAGDHIPVGSYMGAELYFLQHWGDLHLAARMPNGELYFGQISDAGTFQSLQHALDGANNQAGRCEAQATGHDRQVAEIRRAGMGDWSRGRAVRDLHRSYLGLCRDMAGAGPIDEVEYDMGDYGLSRRVEGVVLDGNQYTIDCQPIPPPRDMTPRQRSRRKAARTEQLNMFLEVA